MGWLQIIFILILFTASIGLALFMAEPQNRADVIVALLPLVPGWFIVFANQLYQRWEPARVILHHLKGFVSNRSSKWSIEVEYDVEDIQATDLLDTTLKEITTTLGVGSSEWQDDPHQKIIVGKGLTLRLRAFPGDEMQTMEDIGDATTLLQITMSKLSVPYRENRKMMRGTIVPVFEAVEEVISPINKKYTLEITLEEGSNPYYGYFVHEVPTPQMRQFAVEFDVVLSGAKHAVSIYENRVTVVATRLSALAQLSLRYLSFSTSARPV